MKRLLLTATMTVFLLTGCSPEGHRVSSETLELTVMDRQVLDYRGNVLLTRSQLPGRVSVTPDSEFAVADRFVRAQMSPNGEFLGVTTVGGGHAAAWIYRVGDEHPKPAAFQLGGSLSLDRWHPDSTYLALRHKTPAGAQLLSVTEVAKLSDSIGDANQIIKVPKHDQLSAQHLRYNALGWDDRGLRFNLAGQRWVYHPQDGVSAY